MGVELKLVVVEKYSAYDDRGQEYASVECGKCYDSELSKLFTSGKGIKNFLLSPFNPKRQREAVEYLREQARHLDTTEATDLRKLSNDIEDGDVDEDCYGSKLTAIPIAEVIEALEKDVQKFNYSRMKWALALLSKIHSTVPRNTVYVVAYYH